MILQEPILETGKFGVDGMGISWTEPIPAHMVILEMTKVNIGAGANPGILISGHDLRDLRDASQADRRNRELMLYTFRNAACSLLS